MFLGWGPQATAYTFLTNYSNECAYHLQKIVHWIKGSNPYFVTKSRVFLNNFYRVLLHFLGSIIVDSQYLSVFLFVLLYSLWFIIYEYKQYINVTILNL